MSATALTSPDPSGPAMLHVVARRVALALFLPVQLVACTDISPSRPPSAGFTPSPGILAITPSPAVDAPGCVVSGERAEDAADSFVDLRTGKATPLPVGITSVADASSYQVSPDGTMVAFAGAAGAFNRLQICVANIDGTDVRRITQNAAAAVSPRWSPDGTKIVFVGGYQGGTATDTNLFVVDLATRETTQLTHGSGERVWQPNFSPNGRTILFTRPRGSGDSLGLWSGDPLGLWTVPATGGGSALLLRNAAYGSFSPDGTTIAYRTSRGGVWLADADGSDEQPLVPSQFSISVPINLDHSRPIWSPDGTRIAYERLGFHSGITQVQVVDVATGSVTRIGRGGQPSWLDDDTLIVAQYRREVIR